MNPVQINSMETKVGMEEKVGETSALLFLQAEALVILLLVILLLMHVLLYPGLSTSIFSLRFLLLLFND